MEQYQTHILTRIMSMTTSGYRLSVIVSEYIFKEILPTLLTILSLPDGSPLPHGSRTCALPDQSLPDGSKNNRTHVHPWPKMDSSLHLVPGRYKLPTAPGGSLRKDWGVLEEGQPGWEKAENTFTATSGLPACVCVSCVASIYARVCSSVSCVPLKTWQRS